MDLTGNTSDGASEHIDPAGMNLHQRARWLYLVQEYRAAFEERFAFASNAEYRANRVLALLKDSPGFSLRDLGAETWPPVGEIVRNEIIFLWDGVRLTSWDDTPGLMLAIACPDCNLYTGSREVRRIEDIGRFLIEPEPFHKHECVHEDWRRPAAIENRAFYPGWFRANKARVDDAMTRATRAVAAMREELGFPALFPAGQPDAIVSVRVRA